MKILIVDDHEKIVAAYERTILTENLFDKEISISKTYDCRQGYEAIVNKGNIFDLAIIDQNLPAYEERSIYTGTDLINMIKSNNQACKTILITAYQTPEHIRSIVEKTAPDALAIKSDLTLEKLMKIIEMILNGTVYHTASVKKILNP